jgi:hypothetical protein
MKSLNKYFLTDVKIPRCRIGKKQELESLFCEVMIFANYLRGEKTIWVPRVVKLRYGVFMRKACRSASVALIIKIPPQKVWKKFLIVYEPEGCQKAVNHNPIL